MSRIGFGYDSHRFVTGRPLVLGGVRVAYELGLAGHSDADAVLHAVIDALLGAAGLGDIGEHFPDRDERFRGADSAVLTTHAVGLVAAAGFHVGNCDVTIVTQQPKLGPYKHAMRNRIAELLNVDPTQVNVKAKTNENMGWIGQGEGLAATAVVLLDGDTRNPNDETPMTNQ